MDSRLADGHSLLRTPEKPPERPSAKPNRSFAKLIQERVYLLDGHETNPHKLDTRERFDEMVKALCEQGLLPAQAEARAYQVRENEFGIPKEHGFSGEPVQEWFPGNYAVLLKPLKEKHHFAFLNKFGETTDQAIAKILHVLTAQHAKMTGADPTPFTRDEFGGIVIEGLGVMYGPPERNMTEIVAYVLSCHGKVVGKNAKGEYITEPTTFEEVMDHLPPGFVNTYVDDNTTVFDEVLTTSCLFNVELLEKEMKTSGELSDDDLGNLMSSSPGSGTP